MRARSRARGWALQLLYAWDSRAHETPLPEMLERFTAERRISDTNRAYLDTLIATLAGRIAEVDRAVQAALTNWRLERLAVIDRNILRLGAAEILFLDDVPPRVSIQEAILLAEKYGTRESPRFVNGVLDALMRHAGHAAGLGGSGAGR
jgi:N utilization substance protein B